VRRVVRVTDAFFEQLDAQLGADRGPQAEPSATDFLMVELPRRGTIRLGFDDLPEVVGLPAARVLIASGILVRGFGS
jgi:hypothetical protein